MKSLLAPALAVLALAPAALVIPSAHADTAADSGSQTVTVTMPALSVEGGTAAAPSGDPILFDVGDPVATGGENAGYAPPVGTFQLQEQLRGSATWKVVQSHSAGAAGGANWSVRLFSNARVRLYYTGGTDEEPDNTTGGTDTVTYAPAYSAEVLTLAALYDVSLSKPSGTVESGRVGPSYARRWVTLGRIVHGRQVTEGRTKTNAHGRFSFDLGPRHHGVARFILHFTGGRRVTATKYTARISW